MSNIDIPENGGAETQFIVATYDLGDPYRRKPGCIAWISIRARSSLPMKKSCNF